MNSLSRYILFTSLISLGISCQELPARKALNKSQEVFLKQSALRNKDRYETESKALKAAAEQDSLHPYKKGAKGYYYSLSGGKRTGINHPKKGDWVAVDYQIENLGGKVLYTFEEVETENFLVDREDVLPALREGVKHLKNGEVGVFLFPSYLCYGYQGDGDKIGVSQPLKIYIHLLEHRIN